jgi:glycosyltransferase involved in cell wall biosynthesis
MSSTTRRTRSSYATPAVPIVAVAPPEVRLEAERRALGTGRAARPSVPTARSVVLVCEAASGGAGKHVVDLAERLPAYGYDVLLAYAPGREGHGFAERVARHREFGYEVLTVETGRSPELHDAVAVWELRRAMRRFGRGGRVDVLHGHSSKGGALARLARRDRARHVVYTPHAFYTMSPTLGRLPRAVYGGVERCLARWTDRIIAVSQAEVGHASTLGVDPARVRLVENGITVWSDREAEARRAAARRRLGVADDEVLVGFLGRLAPQKAPDLALQVFTAVAEQHASVARLAGTRAEGLGAGRRIRFVLGGDGPDAARVRAQLAGTGMAERVQQVRDAIGADLIPAFDVFLMTSRYESAPYACLEALNAGAVIVTTDVGGVASCVVDGETGYLVPAAGPEPWAEPTVVAALAGRVGALCAFPERLRGFQRRARAYAGRFAVEDMLARTVDVYRDLHGA